ncbi:MAG TPA: SHOCT domain-containing protein [Streptosporangiaceae bacterium]
MAKAPGRSAGKRVLGVALMVLGVALIGYGAHYLAISGNCSSTGYVSYGPVPKCGGGEALYIISVFFLGPLLAVIGWLWAGLWGVLWPSVCVAVGLGLITIRLDTSAPAGAKSFGLVVGVCFLALAVLSVILSLRKRLRKQTAHLPAPGQAGGPQVVPGTVISAFPPDPAASPGLAFPESPVVTVAPAEASPGSDPLDRIAKLAQLRDSGALTDEEFEREKAKLLAEM